MLPVLTYTHPSAAADALRWRHPSCPDAQAHAAELGLSGAAFPGAPSAARRRSGLLAGRDRGVPHQRRHRRCGAASTWTRPQDDEFEARDRPAAAGRDRPAVAIARAARRARAVPHRGRDRSRRVQRGQGQQRLHEPDGAAQPGPRGRPRGAAGGRGAGAGRHDRGDRLLAERGREHVHPVRRAAGGPPAARRVHPLRAVGLRRTRRRTITRCCCTTRTSSSTASRWSSRRTWCWRCRCGATRSLLSRKLRNFDYYEAPDRPGLLAVGVHAGGDGGRGRAPASSPTTTLPRPRSWT